MYMTNSKNRCYARADRYDNPFAAATAFDGWNSCYTQLSAGKYIGGSKEVRLTDIQVYAETSNVVSNQCGTAWPNSIVLTIPYGMKDEGRINGKPWKGESCVYLGETEYDALVKPGGLLHIAASLEKVLERLEVDERMLRRSLKNVGIINNSVDFKSTIHNSMMAILEEACTHQEFIHDVHVQNELTEKFLDIMCSALSRNLDLVPSTNREKIIPR